jgi:glycosyltransferase 2 family protein
VRNVASDGDVVNQLKTQRRRRWLTGLGKLVATLIVTVFVLRSVGFSAEALAGIDVRTWQISVGPLLASVVVLMLGYFVSAALWGRMVHELGGPGLAVRDAVRLFMIANLGRYVPGKIWQIAGLAALAKTRGVPPAIAGAAAIIGQVIALAGATVIGLGVLSFMPDDGGYRYAWLAVPAVLTLLVIISIPATLDVFVGWIARLAKQEPPRTRLGRSTFGVRWIAFYSLNWGIYSIAFWLLYLGLQPHEPFLLIGPAFAAAYVIGYLALFAPAGVGVREGFMLVFLTPITGPAIGAALAIIARAWTTAVELVPAVYFAAREHRSGPGTD